ncbi:MAG: HIT family protein [Solirubrobacterales bacterium]
MNDCVFCGIVAGDLPAQIVDSDEHTVSFMDIKPATRGHALVVPRNHVSDLLDADDADLERTMVAARRLARTMDAALEPDGFNILNACRPVAWQTVFHYHLHVIPRYEDDPLKLPWIPRGAEGDEIAAIAKRIREAG